jgi:hypothetical protein
MAQRQCLLEMAKHIRVSQVLAAIIRAVNTDILLLSRDAVWTSTLK